MPPDSYPPLVLSLELGEQIVEAFPHPVGRGGGVAGASGAVHVPYGDRRQSRGLLSHLPPIAAGVNFGEDLSARIDVESQQRQHQPVRPYFGAHQSPSISSKGSRPARRFSTTRRWPAIAASSVQYRHWSWSCSPPNTMVSKITGGPPRMNPWSMPSHTVDTQASPTVSSPTRL